MVNWWILCACFRVRVQKLKIEFMATAGKAIGSGKSPNPLQPVKSVYP